MDNDKNKLVHLWEFVCVLQKESFNEYKSLTYAVEYCTVCWPL